MEASKTFKVLSNTTILPADFHPEGFDLKRMEFLPLLKSGCICVARINSSPGWEIKRNGKSEPDHIDLFFLKSGCMRIESASGIQYAAAGEIAVIPSWFDRHITLESDSIHMYFRFDNPENYLWIDNFDIRRCNCIDALMLYLDNLLVENRTLYDEDEYRIGSVRLINILIQREMHGVSNIREREKVEKLLNILHNAKAGEFDAEDIAKKLCMSLSTFRKFCLQNLKKTPGGVICDVRMSRARGLLHYSEMSISDIAEELGYADRFSFSKAFQSAVGISPAGFRRNAPL